MQNSFSQQVQVPTLTTERLVLRPHRLDDFVHSAAMWADPNVTQHILKRPLSEEESWSRLLRYAGHWVLLGFGYWVVEETNTGNFVGEIGFADYKREIQPSLKGVPEIGWVLASRAHGKGYATEVVRAVSAWGDAHFGSMRTACIIAPENAASVRVAEKCGYREFQTATYHGQPALLFVRDAGSSK
jgi:RimJ/RimL family protein N-acetyltransferase